MASYPITKEQLVNASLDAKALEKVINEPAGSPNPGFADGTVTTRSGRVYDTLATAVAKIGQSGGTLGKQTLTELTADLKRPENTVAFVAKDPVPENNGWYIKTGAPGTGGWSKSTYDISGPVVSRLNKYFVSFFGTVVVDSANQVVRYPRMAVMRNGQKWKNVTPEEYGLEYFTAPFSNSSNNEFHYLDLRFIGTASVPVLSTSGGQIPELSIDVIPLGTTLTLNYVCFWTADVVYTNRPALLQIAALQYPIFVDRNGRLNGPAVYVPKIIYSKLPQLNLTIYKSADNPGSDEMPDHVKFSLSSASPGNVVTIAYSILNNQYFPLTYPEVPQGGQGYISIVSIWRNSAWSPNGFPVTEFDAVVKENQCPYGRGSDVDLMPKLFAGCVITDITDPDLLALGFTRGAASTVEQDAKRPYLGMEFNSFIPGAVSFFRCYIETDQAEVYGPVRVYFRKSSNSSFSIWTALSKEKDISDFAAAFSGVAIAPSDPDIDYFYIGTESGSTTASHIVTGVQFHHSLSPCYGILKDDYPSPPTPLSVSEARDVQNMALSALYKVPQIYDVQRPTARYNTKVVFGQSLGASDEAWPSLSRPNDNENLMLGDNPLPSASDGSTYPTFGEAVLKPLFARSVAGSVIYSDNQEAELARGNGARGEPVNHGWLNFAKQLHNRQLMAERDETRVFVTINPSVSGKTIEQLSKKNTQDALFRYGRFLDGLQKVQVETKPHTHVVDGIAWLQGEWNYADHGGSWDKESYKQLLLTLVDDMIADCMTITGQALPPAFFTYQTGASYTRDVDSSGTPGLHVGMAQLEVAIEKKHVYMVGPVYPMTDKGGHLDANGSRWFGCMIGKVWHKVVEQGQHWEPLRPICISRQGNEVYVEFHVPEPPLVFDRPYVLSTALDYKDRGFKVTDTSSNTLPIRMVEIVANTVVKITLASSPSTAAGLYVWYASQSTGGNGCLRDSDPMTSFDTYEFIPERGMYPEADVPALVGKRYPLHNWCVAFHLPVGYGD